MERKFQAGKIAGSLTYKQSETVWLSFKVSFIQSWKKKLV